MIVGHGELPSEHLQALGEIVVNSGRLEDALTAILARAVGGDQDGIIALLSGDPLRTKVDKLRLLASRDVRIDGEKVRGALNDILSDEMAAMIRGLADRCDQARIARNREVHAVWAADPDGRVVRIRKTFRTESRTDATVVTVSDLAAVAQELADATQAASNAAYDQLTGIVHDDWGIPPGRPS